jgi:hypothetical protein
MSSFVCWFGTNVFIPQSSIALRDHISCASGTLLLLFAAAAAAAAASVIWIFALYTLLSNKQLQKLGLHTTTCNFK